jgi:hypothetical protein
MQMKTPDEIKKGLAICCGYEISCRECPYDCSPNSCDGSPEEDAIEYINQLEDRNEKLENALRNLANSSSNAHDAANKVIEHLKSRLAQVERERDAAIHDMVQIVHEVDDNACVWCKNAYFDELKCKECRFYNEGFEWQGVQPTNTKEE